VRLPGSISSDPPALAEAKDFLLDLVHRRARKHAAIFWVPGRTLQARYPLRRHNALLRSRPAFVTATSSGDVIDIKAKRGRWSWTSRCPRRIKPSRRRFDVLLIDAGYVSATDEVSMGVR